MAAAALFADISGHNRNVDLRAYARAGHEVIAIKLTEGATFRSDTGLTRWRLAGELGLTRVGYHYARPGTNPPEAEARNLLDYAHKAGLTDADHLVLDWEDPDFRRNGDEWVRRFKQACGGRLTELYSYGPYLQQTLTSTHGLPYWHAAYIANPLRTVPAFAKDRVVAVQFTNGTDGEKPHTLPGMGGPCDVNRLTVSLAAFRALRAPSKPKEPVVKRWYHDPRKVRRVQRHLRWFYNHYDITPRRGATIVDGKPGPQFKTQVKDVKYLLGYLRPFVRWATGTWQPPRFRFIEVIHAPSMLGERARKRGVDRRSARRRPKTGRAAIARRVIDHPRSRFDYNSPTGGTARIGLEQAAKGGKAHVASPESADTGRWVFIDARILGFLEDLCELSPGPVQITCVVNGDHSSDSGHYLGRAADIGKPVSGSAVYRAAAMNGVRVLDEDAYHFHVYV